MGAAKVLTRNALIRTFQKPCTADLHSLRNHHWKTKRLCPFGQRSDLLLAISGLVVFGPFVDVLLSALDEPVEQASSLTGHRGDGFGSAQTGVLGA
jgi:hypothetical protein